MVTSGQDFLILILGQCSKPVVANIALARITAGPTIIVLVQKLHPVPLARNQLDREMPRMFNQGHVLLRTDLLAQGILGKGTTMPLPPKVIIPLFPRAIVVSGAFEHPLLVPVTMPAAEIVGVVAVSRAHIVIFVKNRLPVLILVAKLNFPYGRRVENISGIV